MHDGGDVLGDLGILSNEGSIGKIISFSSLGELYRYLTTSIIVYCAKKIPKPSVMMYLL